MNIFDGESRIQWQMFTPNLMQITQLVQNLKWSAHMCSCTRTIVSVRRYHGGLKGQYLLLKKECKLWYYKMCDNCVFNRQNDFREEKKWTSVCIIICTELYNSTLEEAIRNMTDLYKCNCFITLQQQSTKNK
jgi:hypothetical protein